MKSKPDKFSATTEETRPEKKETQQIKELIELNDELENYFRNTIIPQLFVDANLILRKFTPPANQDIAAI